MTKMALQLERGIGRPKFVAGVSEEETERVAAEGEEIAAARVRDIEEAVEHRVQQVRQHLRADLAALGQALRKRGEAGDIRKDQRALDGLTQSGIGPRGHDSRNEWRVWISSVVADCDHG